MSALWYKEWRHFAPSWPTLALRLAGPALLLWPLVSHPRYGPVGLGLALGALGTLATAAQVARERQTGIMPRLALTPISPELQLLHRVVSRTLLLLAQVLPVLALAPALIGIALPLSLAATAGGAWIGLQAPTRRIAILTSLSLGLPGAAALAAATAGPWVLWFTAAVTLLGAARTAGALYGYPTD